MKEHNKVIKVLDHGFIRLVDHMGTDASITQAARISYGDGTKTKNDDQGLINYLYRNKHTTPFEMTEFKFHIKLPIFVARQWIRHRMSSYNEMSGRYCLLPMMFYTPKEEDFNTHINTESELDKDGIFYNVGIPTLYDQNDNKNIKLFRYALIRITQHLANQQHVWVMPMSYDKEKGVLIVRVSPNFTHPKYKVDAASREYPKLLANHLNKLYGEGTVISSRSQISFMKDIDFKKLVTSVAYADKKTGNI
jgi:flavin-dependent thymidylate synthase